MLAIKKLTSPPVPVLGLYEKDTIFLVSNESEVMVYVSSANGTTLRRASALSDITESIDTLYNTMQVLLGALKAEILGNASENADTLGKLESQIGGFLSTTQGGTMSGMVEFDAPVKYATKQSTVAVDMDTTSDIDCSLGTFFRKTVDGDVTFAFINGPTFSEVYGLCLLVNFVSGSITLPPNVYFPGSAPLDLSPGNFHLFVMVTDNGGNTWRASVNRNYSA